MTPMSLRALTCSARASSRRQRRRVLLARRPTDTREAAECPVRRDRTGESEALVSCPTDSWDNSGVRERRPEPCRWQILTGWKTREMGVRQGANHSQVRPRTAEQGPRLRGCDPGAGCRRTGSSAFLCTPTRSHPQRGPCSALRCAHLARIRNTAWRRFSSSFRPRISGTGH